MTPAAPRRADWANADPGVAVANSENGVAAWPPPVPARPGVLNAAPVPWGWAVNNGMEGSGAVVDPNRNPNDCMTECLHRSQSEDMWASSVASLCSYVVRIASRMAVVIMRRWWCRKNDSTFLECTSPSSGAVNGCFKSMDRMSRAVFSTSNPRLANRRCARMVAWASSMPAAAAELAGVAILAERSSMREKGSC